MSTFRSYIPTIEIKKGDRFINKQGASIIIGRASLLGSIYFVVRQKDGLTYSSGSVYRDIIEGHIKNGMWSKVIPIEPIKYIKKLRIQ